MQVLPEQLQGRKASEVFLDYCRPVLTGLAYEGVTDLKAIKKLLMVPWTIWNSVVLDENNRGSWSESVKSLVQSAEGGEGFIVLFEERKKNEFGQYNYLMGDFELIPKGVGEFNLRMESRNPMVKTEK